MTTCQKHCDHPVKIYSDCVGCELESLQNENKRLKQQIDELQSLISEGQGETEELNLKLVWQAKQHRMDVARLRNGLRSIRSVSLNSPYPMDIYRIALDMQKTAEILLEGADDCGSE